MSDPVASRELDARVAEKVMGWVWLRHSVMVQQVPKVAGRWSKEWRRSLFIPGNEVRPFLTDDGLSENVPADGTEKVHVMAAPRYCEDIAAAWQVVEKMAERGLNFRISLCSGMWTARFWGVDGVSVMIEANTAPLSICLAALKAIEGGQDV